MGLIISVESAVLLYNTQKYLGMLVHSVLIRK